MKFEFTIPKNERLPSDQFMFPLIFLEEIANDLVTGEQNIIDQIPQWQTVKDQYKEVKDVKEWLEETFYVLQQTKVDESTGDLFIKLELDPKIKEVIN
jgi:chaperonin cofactor prefoldin